MQQASRLYIGVQDVMQLFGCSESTAVKRIKEVNEIDKQNGFLIIGKGKANKHHFAKLFDTPSEDIEEIIRG